MPDPLDSASRLGESQTALGRVNLLKWSNPAIQQVSKLGAVGKGRLAGGGASVGLWEEPRQRKCAYGVERDAGQ